MKKILVINTIGFGFEGISSVIVNYISNMDRSGLQFDFVVQPDIREDYKKILMSLGDIIVIPDRKQSTWDYIIALNKILKKKQFDVIHIHGNSGTMAIEAYFAKIHGIKKILVHCHNTECEHPIVNCILTPIMKKLATNLLACSTASGKWLYGNQKFIVLNNAIDTRRFCFNQLIRDECRNEFALKDEFVIGHIGNFIEQKNHEFLIDIFKEYHKSNSNSKLLLGSDGPKLEEIKKKVLEYNLTDSVIFAGRRSDVERLYNAMDVFVFPSLWEGLPLVLIEAQTSGLPCLVSSVITNEVKCTDNIYYKELSDGAVLWAEKIQAINFVNRLCNRICDIISESGFEITKEADKLRKIYIFTD